MPTLLLADDSFSIARLVEQAFAQEEVTVVAAASGQRAIAQLEADPPDIVLADIGMARVNGYDIAAYVKASPALAHIPVLLLAGPFERIDEQKARATGCAGVVVKPFQPEFLVGLVRAVIAGERPGTLWPPGLPRLDWSEPERVAAMPGAAPPVLAAPSASTESDPGAAGSASGPEPSAAVAPSSPEFDAALDRVDEAFARVDAPASLVRLDRVNAAEFADDLQALYRTGAAKAHVKVAAPGPPAASPPPSPEATSPEHLRMRVKVGGNEFDAEGPADVVQAEFEEFERLTKTEPPAEKPDDNVSKPAAPAPARPKKHS